MAYAQVSAVALATFAAFMAGGLWYGPLFGKAWQAEQAMTDAQWARANKPVLFAIAIVCEAVVALVLAHVLGHIPHDAGITLMLALGSAVGIVTPAIVMNYSFALKSAKLMAIDAGHWIVVMLVIGLVFVMMRV
jgi:nitrate reductase gamma subunit